jgi:hypothetical protein
LNAHYGFADLGALQNNWLEWVKRGSPLPVKANQDELLVAGSENLTLASEGRLPRPEPEVMHQISSDGAAAGQLVPLRRPEQASVSDSSKTGWRRGGGSAQRQVAAGADAHSLASAEDEGGAIISQAARPQPPQPARQIILEWNQPPRGASGVAPAENAATMPQPIRGSVYEGRAKQEVLRR